jgi:hypothetical protein
MESTRQTWTIFTIYVQNWEFATHDSPSSGAVSQIALVLEHPAFFHDVCAAC